jgi:hypothetical protein
LEAAEARAFANRGLWLSRVGPAGWALRADLDADVGASLAAMIDACSRPTAETRDLQHPDAGARDTRDPARRRADAFERILRSAAAAPDLPEHSGWRPTISVLTDYDALRAQLPGIGGVLDDGTPLSAAGVRRLACDAGVLPVVLGTDSAVLDLGRSARLVPPGLRRALVVRDRGCAWPGCDRPPGWCDAHHILHWVDGGPTCPGNCVLLCRRHHTLAHRGDWSIRVGPLGAEFTPPRWVDPERRPRRNTRDHHPDPGRRLRDLVPRGRRPAGTATSTTPAPPVPRTRT